MLKFLKKLVGITQESGGDAPRHVDLADVVDRALSIQSTQDLGDATAALEAAQQSHDETLVAEVVRRLEHTQLGAAARMAAAIWLAHHVTDECEPALDQALVDTLNEALVRDMFGVLLPASIDAVSHLPADRRDAIAARAFADAGRSDQKFRLVKISRSDDMMEVVNQALAQLEDLRIALAEAAFRTSFEIDDIELLLRHYPADESFASPYVVAFGALNDPRTVPALLTALDSKYTRVGDAARRALQKAQAIAEDGVLELLGASRKGQRLGAAAVLEKWDINDRVRQAVQNALESEKVAEVREALLPLAPLEGEVNFRSMHELLDRIPAERRKLQAEAVRSRLAGEDIDWTAFDGHPDELIAIVAHELEGGPTGIDVCMDVLGEVLDVVAAAPLAPWASAWLTRWMRGLYSKGRPLPWDAWKNSHLRFDEAGLQPLVELLLEYQFEGESTLRWFVTATYTPSEQHARLLSHPNRDARLDAAAAMQNAQPGMVEVITPLLQDPRKETREAAALALAEIGDPNAEAALHARLKSERAKDAKQAIESALTSLKLARLKEEDGALEELEPTADNHAKLDARLAGIGAKPKFDVDSLPPLRWTSGEQLSEGTRRWFISTLEHNDFSMPDAELEAFSRHLDDIDRKHLLDALHAGFDPEHREVRIGWVLYSTALLGNEDQISSLGTGLDDMARFASSEQAFRRLEVLERHASNAAIGWIDHWARKAKSAGLRERSRAALLRLAAARGVTPEDLADLVFGDFGLDADGERVFIVGTREIRAKFDTSGEVGVVKDDDTLSTRFPAEHKGDDPGEYERVRDDYRAWRKALKRALKGQIDRLEWSMIWGRKWQWATLLANYSKHPVLRELACSILWLADDPRGSIVVRLNGDLTFSTVDDELVDDVHCVSVAHPAHIPETDRLAWHELFVDYMLVAPFPQFDRPTAVVPEFDGEELVFEDVDGEAMRSRLLASGWQRGEVEDGGAFYDLDREHPNGVSAVVLLDPGLYVARDTSGGGNQDVTLKFFRGSQGIPLSEVPACMLAEICWEVCG